MTSNSKTDHQALTKTKLKLTKNEVHLWFTKPENALENDELLRQYSALLSPEEIIKQQRYKFENDRHDALITRAFVRDLLAYYADVLPQDLKFERNEKGKPELINYPVPLRFNLSHTKDLIICAVTLNDDIGCDVENTGRNNNVLGIADRYFSESETSELFSLVEAKQRDRFFDYWTLKEAYIKAWGLGLAIPLGDFSFHFDQVKETSNGNYLLKQNIQLSFATHRKDDPSVWRNWLVYPNEHCDNSLTNLKHNSQHRIAVSLRASENNQKTDYQFRFFNSLPLLGYQEA